MNYSSSHLNKALPADDPEDRLLALIASAEPRLRRALTQAIVAANAANTLEEVEALKIGRAHV